MTTRTPTVAALLAAVVLGPAAGQAAAAELRGAPTLRQTSTHEARVQITTADRLATADEGHARARVSFSDQGRFALRADGRHGRAHRYVAVVRHERPLRAGARYTVRLHEPGHRPRTLRLKLVDAR